MREELIATLEVIKKDSTQVFISSMLVGDDIKGEYIDPIPSPDLSTSSDSNPRKLKAAQPELM